MSESNTFLCQSVDIRSVGIRITVAPKCGAHVLGCDPDNIGLCNACAVKGKKK